MRNNRNCTIDFVKASYCLIIVGLHSVYLQNDGIRHLFPHGYLAVEFFFIVSGYLMANSAFNKDVSVEVYMLKKYRSLLPYIIFAWISGALIIYFAHSEISVSTHIYNYINSIWQILMLDLAGFNGYQVIGSFWYLSAMFLTMPPLYYSIKKIPFFTSGGGLVDFNFNIWLVRK